MGSLYYDWSGLFDDDDNTDYSFLHNLPKEITRAAEFFLTHYHLHEADTITKFPNLTRLPKQIMPFKELFLYAFHQAWPFIDYTKTWWYELPGPLIADLGAILPISVFKDSKVTVKPNFFTRFNAANNLSKMKLLPFYKHLNSIIIQPQKVYAVKKDRVIQLNNFKSTILPAKATGAGGLCVPSIEELNRLPQKPECVYKVSNVYIAEYIVK